MERDLHVVEGETVKGQDALALCSLRRNRDWHEGNRRGARGRGVVMSVRVRPRIESPRRQSGSVDRGHWHVPHQFGLLHLDRLDVEHQFGLLDLGPYGLNLGRIGVDFLDLDQFRFWQQFELLDSGHPRMDNQFELHDRCRFRRFLSLCLGFVLVVLGAIRSRLESFWGAI